MKRIAILLFLIALAGPGCVALEKNWFEPKAPPAPSVVKEPEPPPPPPPTVSASQINEANAADKLIELRTELDDDDGERTPMPVRPAAKK